MSKGVVKESSKTGKLSNLPKNKFIAVVVLIVFLSLLVAVSLLFIIGQIGAYINLNYAKNNIAAVGSNYTPELDSEGYWTFTLDEDDEDLNVMQLTDLHIGAGWLSLRKDRLAINAIVTLVEYNKPDLIILTGDLVYPMFWQSGTYNNGLESKTVIAILDSLQIPYAVVFGNHDYEWNAFKSLSEIASLYENGEYSLFQRQSGGGEDVYGEGNYVIKVKNADETMHSAYILMDSNSYLNLNSVNFMGGDGYDIIHYDQIEWYKQEVDKLGETKTFLFFHIPLYEYGEAWDAYKNGDPDATYYFGYQGDGGSFPGYENNGFFDVILEKGSTVGLFCGHDHLNNYSIEYKGVRLTYGLSIDYLAYIGIKNSNFQRGCLMILDKGYGDFEITQCVLAGLIGY